MSFLKNQILYKICRALDSFFPTGRTKGPFHTGRGKRWNRRAAAAFSRSGSVCAVEAVLASRPRGGRYHSYKQQITFVFPKLNK